MSAASNQALYDILTTDADIIALVPVAKVSMGVQKAKPTTFPCIIVTQIGGSDVGYIGYGSAPSGSKFGMERLSYQIDIYNQTVPKTNLTILDAMKVPLMRNGYHKTSDNDIWDDAFNAYRKITRWDVITDHLD